MKPTPAIVGQAAGEPSRVVSLDLLRGLAAYAVAIPHFQMYFWPDGSSVVEAVSIAAVEIFFTLSGFVLGNQIVLCATRGDGGTLRTFLVRRWMRTIPAYLLALFAISILNKEIGSADFFRYAAYVQNFLRQHNNQDYFAVAWSLSVEEWYYVIFPTFLLSCIALTGVRPSRAALIWMTVGFVAGIAVVRVYFGDTSDWGAQVRRVVVFRVDSIAYGFLLYLVLEKSIVWRSATRAAALVAFAVASAALVAINLKMVADEAVWLRQINPFVSAIFGISTIVFFISCDQMLRSNVAREVSLYLGRISYSTYLFHLVVLILIGRVAGSGLPWLWLFAVYLVSLVAASTIIFFTVEQPILSARPSFDLHPIAPPESNSFTAKAP